MIVPSTAATRSRRNDREAPDFMSGQSRKFEDD